MKVKPPWPILSQALGDRELLLYRLLLRRLRDLHEPPEPFNLWVTPRGTSCDELRQS
jgi:hypothetical protein